MEDRDKKPEAKYVIYPEFKKFLDGVFAISKAIGSTKSDLRIEYDKISGVYYGREKALPYEKFEEMVNRDLKEKDLTPAELLHIAYVATDGTNEMQTKLDEKNLQLSKFHRALRKNNIEVPK